MTKQELATALCLVKERVLARDTRWFCAVRETLDGFAVSDTEEWEAFNETCGALDAQGYYDQPNQAARLAAIDRAIAEAER